MALNIKRIFKIYKKNSCKFKAGDIVEVDTNGNIYVNGNKTDNRAVNLVYKHHRDNMLNPNTKFKGHTIESRKKQSESQKGLLLNRKDMSKEVYQYDKKYNLIAKYPSIAEACRTLGHHYRICDVCRGKRKTAKGYYWSYNLITRKEEVA